MEQAASIIGLNDTPEVRQAHPAGMFLHQCLESFPGRTFFPEKHINLNPNYQSP
jgi:hypothetical protein